MANNNVVTLTDSNFEDEVTKSTTPVIVDFWASWCGPCKMIAPILDEIAAEKAGAVKVGKINVEDCSDLALRFRIQSIPTLLIFKNGEVREQIVGLKSKKDLLARIDALAAGVKLPWLRLRCKD